VDAVGRGRERGAVAPGAHGERLGQDRDGGLGRRVGAEVEAGGAVDPLELLVRQARLEELVAPLRLRPARADRADVEGVGREGGLERGDVELEVVREHHDRGAVVGREPCERDVGPLDEELVRARDPLPGREGGARVDAGRVPAEQLRRSAERLGQVDRADDDEPRRRAVELGEDPHPLVLLHPVPAQARRERRERGRRVADRLVPVEQDEQLGARARPLDDGEEDGPLVGVRELEQPVGDAHSKRSTKTSISPPQGSPTPKASSSEMP
jgi:hypothetical protein